MLVIALGRLSQQDTYSRLIWATETFKKRKLLSLRLVGDKLPRKEKKTFENPLGNRRVLI